MRRKFRASPGPKGKGFDNNQGKKEPSIILNLVENEKDKSDDIIFEKFIVDSGATHHLANTKLLFNKLNENKKDLIKCAIRKRMHNF